MNLRTHSERHIQHSQHHIALLRALQTFAFCHIVCLNASSAVESHDSEMSWRIRTEGGVSPLMVECHFVIHGMSPCYWK